MQLFGRQMVIFCCKFFLLLAVLGVAAIVGTVGYILGNQSWAAFGAVAWVALTVVALGTVPLLRGSMSGSIRAWIPRLKLSPGVAVELARGLLIY